MSLPLEEIEKMEQQVNEWEKESISSRGDVAQDLKTKLFETKEKLDKLVPIYLDGDIEREIYLERKDVLFRQCFFVWDILNFGRTYFERN